MLCSRKVFTILSAGRIVPAFVPVCRENAKLLPRCVCHCEASASRCSLMSFFGLLTRKQSPTPASHEQAVAAFLQEQTLGKTRKDVAEQMRHAPTHQVRRAFHHLPAHVVTKSGKSMVCAAYRVSCVRGAKPLRGSIALASGPGGLGQGTPVQMSDGTQMPDGTFWRLRAKDFCRPPPVELG